MSEQHKRKPPEKERDAADRAAAARRERQQASERERDQSNEGGWRGEGVVGDRHTD